MNTEEQKSELKFYESPFHATHDKKTADKMMAETDKEIDEEGKK